MKTGEDRVIDDIWIVESALGKGGMGSVYKCRNRFAPRITAAIKILSTRLLTSEVAKQRFVREAEILYGLDHPHIVKVRSIRLDAAPPYIEMEFVEGRSLGDMLADEGALERSLALRFAEHLGSAIRYLHRSGVYHRDIKPANLLVSNDGLLKLVDFGLAKEAEDTSVDITQDGAMLGTVAYAPPEWVRPASLKPELWDVYAMGVVIYEMLTGDAAFAGPSQGNLRQTAVVVMTDKQALECLDPGPDHGEILRGLVRQLTARDPEDRITTARDALAIIQALQEGERNVPGRVHTSDLDREALRAKVLRDLEDRQNTETPLTMERLLSSSIPPRPVEETGQRRSGVGRGLVRLILAGVVIGLLFVSGVAAIGFTLAFIFREGPSPTDDAAAPRNVRVELQGAEDPEQVGVELGGRAPQSREGAVLAFEDVPLGLLELRWALGDACEVAVCPGESCPSWCASGSLMTRIEAGSGPLTIPVAVARPAPRDLEVRVADFEGSLALEGLVVPFEGGLARVASVRPGPHTVVVTSRGCAEDDVGCGGPEACPAGCVSVELPVEVGLGQGPVSLSPEVPRPARAAPARRHVAQLVTQRAFARWLGANPSWTRDAAMGAGRADGTYLRGFDPAAASGGPMVEVSWLAAAAFCKAQGGLAPLDASPLTWPDLPGVPYIEWRAVEGRPSWRQFDGTTSTTMDPRQATVFTAFRCAR